MQGFSFHLTLFSHFFSCHCLIFNINGVTTFCKFIKKFTIFVLHNGKSNSFGTLELHAVNLIVIVLCCGCPHRFDITLFLRSNQNDIFCRFFIFFAYMKIICQTPSKNSDCKTQITVKEIGYRQIVNRLCLQYIQIPNFWYLTKVVGTTFALPIPLSYLRRWNGNFESDFSIKILRIHLLRDCHILPILLSFFNIKEITLN